MSRKTYPSDITREQFEAVLGLLEGARKHKMAPGKVDWQVMPAVRNMLADGGYTGGPVRLGRQELLGALVTIAMRSE